MSYMRIEHHGYVELTRECMVEVARFYHDENQWEPDVACGPMLSLIDYFNPEPDSGYNDMTDWELEELPF